MKLLLTLASIFCSIYIFAGSQNKNVEVYEVHFGRNISESPSLKWPVDKKTHQPEPFTTEEKSLHYVKIVFENGDFVTLPSVFSVFDQENKILNHVKVAPFEKSLCVPKALEMFRRIMADPHVGFKPRVQKYFEKRVHENIIINQYSPNFRLNGELNALTIYFHQDIWAKAIEKEVRYHPFFTFFKNDLKIFMEEE